MDKRLAQLIEKARELLPTKVGFQREQLSNGIARAEIRLRYLRDPSLPRPPSFREQLLTVLMVNFAEGGVYDSEELDE